MNWINKDGKKPEPTGNPDPATEAFLAHVQMGMSLPFMAAWVEYKGEKYFAGYNPEKSLLPMQPMIDLCHCATDYHNDRVLMTVPYEKQHFTVINEAPQ